MKVADRRSTTRQTVKDGSRCPLCLAVGTLMLVACGNGPTDERATTEQVTAAVALPVGDPVAARVARIVSASGSIPGTQGTLAVPAAAQNALVLAVDASGTALLAALNRGSLLDLDYNTTASTLVALALESSATPANAVVTTTVIASAPSFAALVEATRAVVEGGGSPFGSKELVDPTRAVAAEVRSVSGPGASPTRPAGASSGFDRSGTVLTNLLPHALTGGLAGALPLPGTVYVDDASGPGVNVFNWSGLDWEAVASDSTGRTLATESLPRRGYDLWGLLTLSALPEPVFLSGNATRFTVTVRQSDATRASNAVQLINSFLLLALESTGAAHNTNAACALSVAQRVLNERFPALLTQADGAAVVSYFSSAAPGFLDDPTYLWGLAANCTQTAGPQDLLALVSANVARLWFTWWTALSAATDIVGRAQFVYQLATEWNGSHSVEVCKSGGAAIDCTAAIWLSGGSNMTALISVDDELKIYVNGEFSYSSGAGDHSVRANRGLSPFKAQVKVGDLVRIEAWDYGGCRDLSPLYFFNETSGTVQEITSSGVPVTCSGGQGKFFEWQGIVR